MCFVSTDGILAPQCLVPDINVRTPLNTTMRKVDDDGGLSCRAVEHLLQRRPYDRIARTMEAASRQAAPSHWHLLRNAPLCKTIRPRGQ